MPKFLKIASVIIVIIIILAFGYLYLTGKVKFNNEPVEKIVETTQENKIIGTETNDWKTYRNEEYGFEMKYPPNLILRNGNRDYKTTGLNNFYQFCNKVVATPDDTIGSNDNFVGYCDGEFFRVNIWNSDTEMKMIANDLEALKLDKENKITIGDKKASDFVYSGYGNILGGAHIWHLFVLKTKNHTYSLTGDSCMDNGLVCNQILSTFKFTK